MCTEIWTWNELLAFDVEQPDFGVEKFLAQAHGRIHGVSLFLSAPDFVLQHHGLEHEEILPPDCCSRHGHSYNELRKRQAWSNLDLKRLIEELQRHQVKVFFSIFRCYCGDKFHPEWLSLHLEVQFKLQYADFCDPAGINVLGRLDDGQLFEDIFIAKLQEVMQDYGFDGFHAPDGYGPGASLGYAPCEDEQFHEFLGADSHPALAAHLGNDITAIEKRLEFIWEHYPEAWRRFNCARWRQFWSKLTGLLRSMGRLSMMNSPFTEGAAAGIYSFGIDYREICNEVDYLIIEAVPASLDMVFGGNGERQFRHAAVLSEFRALLPDSCKILFLNGVKDTVEGWDALNHGRGALELEIYGNFQQWIFDGSAAMRHCADGALVCLADGMTAPEWDFVLDWYDLAHRFTPAPGGVGDLAWVVNSRSIDGVVRDYPKWGSPHACEIVSRLFADGGIQCDCVLRLQQLRQFQGAILVPDFDHLNPGEQAEVCAYDRGLTVVYGNLATVELPRNAAVFSAPLTPDYRWGFAIWNAPLSAGRQDFAGAEALATPRPPANPVAAGDGFMHLPTTLFEAVYAALRKCLESDRPVITATDTPLRVMRMHDANGHWELGLVSRSHRYLAPQFHFRQPPEKVRKISGFPVADFKAAADGLRNDFNGALPRIPPYGVLVFECN